MQAPEEACFLVNYSLEQEPITSSNLRTKCHEVPRATTCHQVPRADGRHARRLRQNDAGLMAGRPLIG